MNKIDLLLREWDFCYDKEDWYPPLAHVLRGVTAAQASWRPAGEAANTIWENVNHLTFYKERFLKRLKGEESEYPQGIGNDDTFVAKQQDEKAWQESVARLEAVHREIREVLAGLKEEDFDRPIPKNTIGLWASSLVMHDAYHTGQIVLIRKLQGSWPSRRSFE
jgi:uncharacterized damage-inducible protein DinB